MTTRKLLEFVSSSVQTTSQVNTQLLNINLVSTYGINNTVCRTVVRIIGKDSSNRSACVTYYDIFYVNSGTLTSFGYGQAPFIATGSTFIYVGGSFNPSVVSNNYVISITPGNSNTTNWTAWLDISTGEI